MKYTRRHQLGFSLVEIMIGMTLGLFLTTGIIQLFIGSNRNYQFYEAFAITQENGRFALELLNNSIRMTNFTGCSLTNNGVNLPVENVLNNTGAWSGVDWWKNVRTGWAGTLIGYDGTQVFPGQAFGTSSANDRIRGTDAIISLSGSGNYPILNANAQTFTIGQITRTNGRSLQKGDLMLVCNPTNVSLFQITSDIGNPPFVIAHAAGGNPGNNTPNLVVYNSESTMVDYSPTAFYIGVSTSKTTRSLFQMQLQVTETTGEARMVPEEMVEGVWDMQIYYGVDTTNPTDRIPDEYRDAINVNVTDWARVVSVRINLLLVSLENNVLTQEQTYLFPNDIGDNMLSSRKVDADTGDKHWYQVFTTTIGIRNRMQ